MSVKPTFAEEKRLIARGYKLIAGVDEAGRGALAGPVVAAAVILPTRLRASWTKEVRDSKLLRPVNRETLFTHIKELAISVGVGTVSYEIIDKEGIARATQLAMKIAVEQLSPRPETLLIDFMLLPDVPLPQKGVLEGDSVCFSIACASIIAKVTRDHLMIEFDHTYPGYGLANHKGYGTREHLECLCQLGPCPIHRCSFYPVSDAITQQKK